MSKANTVCIDFDWTLCSDDNFGKPNDDMVALINKLFVERYSLTIYTSRKEQDRLKLYNWLAKYNLFEKIDYIVFGKPEAVAYIDDRAVRYLSKRLAPFLEYYWLKTENYIKPIKKESEELLNRKQ